VTHYQDKRWTAVPSAAVSKAILDHHSDPAFIKRFYDTVDVGFDIDDCHIWTGALSDQGYGNFTVKRHTVRAHRVAWVIRNGIAVPEETPFLDHVNCLGRWCVNPDHLEPVTNEENTHRGVGIGASNQRVSRSLELIRREELRAVA
jgi:hypothetical protein